MSDPAPLPAISKEPLSVILLARNEVDHLPEVLDGWIAHLDALSRDHEILIVDDGSTDGTAGMASFLARGHPQITIHAHPEARGLGAALRTGIGAARHPLLFYTTCDEQFQPSDLGRLLEGIDPVHLVSGFRKSARAPLLLRWLGALYRGFMRILCGDGPRPLPGWLGWSGHFRYGLARLLFGVRFHDVDCAYRIFRRSIFARVPIQSDGPFAQIEILAKANFVGCLMSDEVVLHRPRADKLGLLHAPWRQTLKEIIHLLRHPDFGPPHLPANGEIVTKPGSIN